MRPRAVLPPLRDGGANQPHRTRGVAIDQDRRLQQAACTYRIALGPRAGQKVLTLQTLPNRVTPSTSQRCVNEQGFSLHAEVRLALNQRHKLEHLCRPGPAPRFHAASRETTKMLKPTKSST